MTTTPNTYRTAADQIGVTHTVRISCDCDCCATNAAKIGHPFPLAAYVNEVTASRLKITARNANRASKTHATVHMAHHPLLSVAQRVAIPVE